MFPSVTDSDPVENPITASEPAEVTHKVYTINKQDSTIDMQDSTIDKQDSTIDMQEICVLRSRL